MIDAMARAATTSDVFNAIAEPQRREILVLLRGGERPVTELAQELGMTQPGASKHLRVLREVGLVRDRKAGKLRLYGLDARGLRPVHEWAGGFERFWNESFDRLDAYGIPRAVATSTRRARAEVKLRQSALLPRFTALVGGDEVAHGKPAPDIYLEAARRLGVPARACLVLEDSDPGVRAALAAGMTPIMVPDLLPPSHDLLARGVIVDSSLTDVAARLAQLACDNK